MDPRLIEYDERREKYLELGKVVDGLITSRLKELNLQTMQVAYRVKTKESLAGKLARKSDKYPTLLYMTDIVGFRIICYFADQVDEVAKCLKELFDVDKENSIDKRSAIPATAFGYLSLHYICRLKNDGKYPEELCEIPFEIQMRSVLQHTWAEIEHDLGYKSEFEVPREIRREFSRVAGLLEVADELFLNIKEKLEVYEDTVRTNIANDCAGEMTLDRITLSEYVKQSKTMKALLNEITSITGASINEVDPESFLPQLEFMGLNTLADLREFIHKEHDGALLLAKDALEGMEIDELASTVGLYYLVRSRLTFGDYDEEKLRAFFELNLSEKEKIQRQVDRVIRKREKFK
ncbi:MAG: hypothetical protein IJ757_03135 [Clostridiales bacterium]|nr:hypothetical protein [Clostridiales bacterium]